MVCFARAAKNAVVVNSVGLNLSESVDNRMKSSKHFVLLFASVMTSFLIGAGVVGWSVSKIFLGKLGDMEYLQKRVSDVQRQSQGEPAAAVRRKLVRVMPAVRQKLGSTRFFSGRLVEIQKVVVASETTGPVVSMPIEVGMAVKKGETLIAEIDTVWTRLATEQAEKRLDVSRVKLQFEQNELTRFTRLSEMGKGMVSESDLESQMLRVSELEANIKLEEVALEEARKKLARSRIVAPFDGTIVRKIAELGAYVSPGSSIAEIVSGGLIDAELTIAENYIDRLSVGDTVPVWIDPLNMETRGEIFSIVPYGSTAARAFPVRIRMDDMNGRLKVGMSVRGRIQVTDPKESIVLPKDAVLDRPDGALVWIVTDGKNEAGETDGRRVVQPVQIVIAARTEDRYAVVPLSEEGRAVLTPGVECVIEGAERLAVGEEVEIIGIDPALTENLPKASGHVIIPPIDENPFFTPNDKSDSQTDDKSDGGEATAPLVPVESSAGKSEKAGAVAGGDE